MSNEFRESFAARHRRTIALGAPIAAVILVALLYNATKPKSTQNTDEKGAAVPESELLQVGALPVT